MQQNSRVAANTAASDNNRINEAAEMRLQYYTLHPEKINSRLKQLGREWDIERILEVNSSALSLIGLLKGLRGNRTWLLLPIAVQSFFMQHALQGWCPPLPLLRRLGVRTADEIEAERLTLEALRSEMPLGNSSAAEFEVEVSFESEPKFQAAVEGETPANDEAAPFGRAD